MIENFQAVLTGCAIGDTLGMPVEGWKREQIKKYLGEIKYPIDPVIPIDEHKNPLLSDEFGKLKYWGKDLKKGDWTDDTILTLAIARSIAHKRDLDLEDIAKKHIIEYSSRLKSDGTVVGGFGKTTTDAIKNLISGKSPLHSGVIGGPGNGPAMKMAPVGLFMSATSQYQRGIQYAYLIGKMTHLDPRSIASGVVQAHAIYSLLQNVSKNEFLHSLESTCKEYESPISKEYPLFEKGTLTERLTWIKDNRDVDDESAFKFLGNNSLVIRSYPFALFMFQKYWDQPLDGLLKTVNFGGDCDTTGAIYGSLAGAKHKAFYPKEWELVLKDHEMIKDIANRIYAIR